MKSRLIAVVVAVALVAGALLVRRGLIEDGDDDSADGDNATATELVCVTELTDVCTTLAGENGDLHVTIEDAGLTLDRLGAGDEATVAPLWLTFEPYPAMVDDLRASTRAEPIAYATTPLAASPLGVALPPDGRLDVLVADCAGAPLWRCIGDDAGAPWTDLGGEAAWGTLRPAFGNVDASALALSSFAASVAGYFDDASVTRSRWEAETSFIPWLRGLVSTSTGVSLSGPTALRTMATRPSALDIAATAEFELAAVDATSERFARNYPAPEMWLQAVLATPGDATAPGALAGDLSARLVDAGWNGAETASTPPPSASTMLALRALWEDAV